MLYASHRIVGVMELEPSHSFDESNSIHTRHAPTVRATAMAIRRIEFELVDSRTKPQAASEPTVKVNSAALQRELDAELAKLLANSDSVALS